MALPGIKLGKPKKASDLVGVHLHDDRLKLAHVRIGSLKREVADLASFDIRGMQDSEISALIRKTLAELKIVEPKAFLTVPLHTVITRSIEIPSRDPEEIREIVNLQASRHTPYARSEIVIDVLHIGTVRENYTKVLLVIAPREVVTRHTKIMEAAGLTVQKVLFPPEAIGLACSQILGPEAAKAPVAIVHMDGFFTGFSVVQKNVLLFVRGISIGASHLLEEKELYRDRFVEELNKSIESYTTDEAGPAPSLLLLTGVVAEMNDLDYLFDASVKIPIKHQTYVNHFAISEKARAVAAAAKQVSFFNLIAPLLLHDKMKVDLVTEERKLKMQLEERTRQTVNTCFLVLILLGLTFTLFAGKVYFKSSYLHRLIARYQPARDESKQIETIFEKTQAVKNHLAKRGTSVEALSELYTSLPNDVKLNFIRYEGAEKFSVKGTSRTMASVFTFVTNLEKSDIFKNVKTKYVTSRSDGGQDVADFEIVSVMEGSAES